jgi:hypothetical protein
MSRSSSTENSLSNSTRCAYDVLLLRRVHRSTMWAAPLVFAAGSLAVPFGMTPAWHHFAKFLMRVAVPYV